MDFLKLLLVFTQCYLLYQNIPVAENQIVYISCFWTIVDRQLGFNFWNPVSDNFTAEQDTATFDTQVVPTIGYTHHIVFDLESLFISSYVQSWAASKRIKLEPSIL